MTKIDPRDRKLDWYNPLPDPRNVEFPIRAALPAVIPRVQKLWAGPYLRVDQGREGACFPPGTLVRMADGSHKAIEDVRTLDAVLTAEGNHQIVLGTMVRRADELVTVSIRGHLPLTCTREHPILTAHGYAAAGDLRPGDKVAITRGYVLAVDTAIDITSIVQTADLRGVIAGVVNTGGVITEVAPLPALLAKTPALGRLLGLYAAEGSTTANKVVWSFGGHEEHTLVAETVALIKSAFDAAARLQRRPNGTISVVLYGKTWRRLFETLVPGTARHGDKHLSPHVTTGDDAYRSAVLHGWLDGDGHARRTEVAGVSVCRRLVLDMHGIANDLGLTPRLSGSAPSINRHAATRQYRYEMALPLGGGSNASPPTGRRAVWRTVTGVEAQPYDGWVHNLHVRGDESYVADGVGVHNCVGFGWAIELLSSPVRVRPRGYLTSYGALTVDAANVFGRDLYRAAKQVDEFEGEDYDGTSVLAGAKVVKAKGYVAEYRWAESVRDIVDTLITTGPVVMGIPWFEGMYRTDAKGLVNVAGGLAGGHCITLTGYYPMWHGLEVVRWRNSWGADYGVRGDGFVTVGDLSQLLGGTGLTGPGEACVPLGRSYGSS